MSDYDGPVVFVQGVHYPVAGDHADLDSPLRVDEDGGWRLATEGETLHNDANHQNDLTLDPGGEN